MRKPRRCAGTAWQSGVRSPMMDSLLWMPQGSSSSNVCKPSRLRWAASREKGASRRTWPTPEARANRTNSHSFSVAASAASIRLGASGSPLARQCRTARWGDAQAGVSATAGDHDVSAGDVGRVGTSRDALLYGHREPTSKDSSSATRSRTCLAPTTIWSSTLAPHAMWSDEPPGASERRPLWSCEGRCAWWPPAPADAFPSLPPNCGSPTSPPGVRCVRPSTIGTSAVESNYGSVAIRRPTWLRWSSASSLQVCHPSSSARSMGRTPRTCFLSSFLACRSASEIGLAASRR